jgi:pimeloyl-ACP methyl ester carboxylesterase
MARFVLVHGAFAGAWTWERVIPLLEAAGHTAEAFDLPGSGDDRTPVEEITLDAYAGRLCEVLGARAEPAVVAANSMGGVVVTQAAARCPLWIASIVYVAAFVPQDGQSLLDLTRLPEGQGDETQANLVVEGDPPVASVPGEAARWVSYGCASDEVAAWAIERRRPQAVAPFTQPVDLGETALDGVPRSYVLCKRDRSIPPELQRRMLRESGCEPVIELDTDHVPMLSRPEELAAALGELAGA